MKIAKLLFLISVIMGLVTISVYNFGWFVFFSSVGFWLALKASFLYWQYFFWLAILILFFWRSRYTLLPLILTTPSNLIYSYKQFFVYNLHTNLWLFNDIAAICALLMVLFGFSYHITFWSEHRKMKRKNEGKPG